MPSLIDLQGTPTANDVKWEAVLVNRVADSNLLKLEQKAMGFAVKSREDFEIVVDRNLVHKLAILVAEYMGGSVEDPESMSRAWRSLSYSLKATLGSMVLPLGSLTIGLARHRALLFKVPALSFCFLSCNFYLELSHPLVDVYQEKWQSGAFFFSLEKLP
jgi:hypothetical protein